MRDITRVVCIALFVLLFTFEIAKSEECTEVNLNAAGDDITGCDPRHVHKKLLEGVPLRRAKDIYILGRIYLLGGMKFGLPNIEKDQNIALSYYKESAELGYVEAQQDLAFMLNRYYGEEEESDYWYCKAAEQDNEVAIINIENKLAVTKTHTLWQEFCDDISERGR